MSNRSISLRLIFGAALWIVFALVIAGAVLTGLFRSHVERAFDSTLYSHMEELLAFTSVDAGGLVVMKRHPSDPQFVKPLSGWYWVMRTADGRLQRSRSLWDQRLDIPADRPGERSNAFASRGPRNEPLRAVSRTFTLPEGGKPFTILVAGPADDIETAVLGFINALALALALLGLGLIAAVVLQVRYGLRPLKHMRDVLADIRAGRATRMEGGFAAEIEPLADELNALLDHNTDIIARARTQAGNLAHALKTPLAVLTNEADRIGGQTGEVINRQNALMAEQIDRHLSRARVAGSYGVLGAHSDVDSVAEGLRRTLSRIYAERQIEITLEGIAGLAFQGERQDLEEMLGNLMDNACKWARGRVRVSADGDGASNQLLVMVDDDGPGIPEDSMEEVLGRGRRLDETMAGSGLGLSIARDIAELYGGSLKLARSPLGGLSARLGLPSG